MAKHHVDLEVRELIVRRRFEGNEQKMKNLVLLAIGVAIGVFAVNRLQHTDQGRQFFDELDTRTREFTDAVKDGYASREHELRGE